MIFAVTVTVTTHIFIIMILDMQSIIIYMIIDCISRIIRNFNFAPHAFPRDTI